MVLLRAFHRLPVAHYKASRSISTVVSPLAKFFRVSEEIRAAITARRPVVALESAIYTHGFPYPENVQLAQDMESTVRKHGAVPATICVLNGVCKVGLDSNELVQMAESAGKKDTLKVSRRDIPYLTGMRLVGKNINGGTTIAGTMVLAEMAGIRVFATGGLGGVHRGAEHTMDISADLTELGRTNVAVISSGSKAFLDLEKTLEYLETQGVLVSTFGKRGERVDFPAFYSRESGLKSPNVVESPKEAAAIIHASHTMGLTSGQLFANPIPTENEIPSSELKDIIARAVERAKTEGFTGKDNTPYILDRIKQDTNGKAVIANRALVLNNAKVGAEVAVALAELEGVNIPSAGVASPVIEGTFIPAYSSRPASSISQDTTVPRAALPTPTPTPTPTFPDKVPLLIIGGIAVDYSCNYLPPTTSSTSPKSAAPEPSLHTSNPSRITETVGGVAHNVFTAANLYLNGPSPIPQSPDTTPPPPPPPPPPPAFPIRLISAVANDLTGNSILTHLKSRGIDTSGIHISNTSATARYIALNDANGGLFTAAADMAIIETLGTNLDEGHVHREIRRGSPEVVCLDGNLSGTAIGEILHVCRSVGARVVFEPTSVAKAIRMFQSRPAREVFPNTHLYLATPNTYELKAMYDYARANGMFDGMEWFQVIDEFNIDATFRDAMATLTQSTNNTDLSTLLHTEGILQQSIHLLPYIPNLFVKLGKHGVLTFRILPPSPPSPSPSPSSSFPRRIATSSRPTSTPSLSGIEIRYFPPAELVDVEKEEVINVNGVGDTFLGVVLGRLVDVGPGALDGRELEETVGLAQRAAVMSLRSREAVGEGVARLRRGV